MDFPSELLVTGMVMALIWKRVVSDKILDKIINCDSGEALELLSNKAPASSRGVN